MDVGVIRIGLLAIAIMLVAGVVFSNATGTTALVSDPLELRPDFTGPNERASNSDACRDMGPGCIWDSMALKCVCSQQK